MLKKFLSVAFLIALPLSLQAKVYQLSQGASEVGFSIVKFKIGEPVPGQFNDFSGSIEIENQEMKSVQATIQTASIDTERKKRDKHLRSEDFFFVEKYPTMTFVSTESVKIEEDFEVPGKLTIRGVTKPVVLDVEKVNNREFVAKTTINRLDYGVSWNKTMEKSDWSVVFGSLGKLVLDEKVQINIRALLE